MSDTGQNLRHNVDADNDTLTDATLTSPVPPPATPGVTGAAYTNNDVDADTATTLYDLDTTPTRSRSSRRRTRHPRGDRQARGGRRPQAGFDIYSAVRNGATVRTGGSPR